MKASLKEATVLAIAVFICISLGGILAAWHAPLDNPGWKANGGPAGLEVRVYHFLARDCECSAKLQAWLERDRALPPAQFREIEVLEQSGGAWEARDLASRVPVELPAIEGLQAAPWLLLLDAAGKQLYAGGYEKAPLYSKNLLMGIAAGRPVKRLPVRGCAVGTKRRSMVPALRWKDWWRSI
jgi:hypothetical protein